MKYRGIFEYEYPTEHKPPISIDVHLHGDCVKGKIIEWEYRPLEQEPRKGHWVKHDTGHSVYYDCFLCGCVAPCTEFADSYLWKLSNFCPDCGADMRGEEV